MIYCLILISDSIMVPCYGCNALNIKGCVILVLYVKSKNQGDFFWQLRRVIIEHRSFWKVGSQIPQYISKKMIKQGGIHEQEGTY